jgi:hypothetical protein
MQVSSGEYPEGTGKAEKILRSTIYKSEVSSW